MKLLRRRPTPPKLVYAATHRCPCGAGLAYIPGGERSWDCSAILLGTADEGVKHTGVMPFVFYEILSEQQPSARGATTRPS